VKGISLTALIATLSLYAIVVAMFARVVVNDWLTAKDWEYCGQYTSCADSECCIQAIAEKEYHLKFD
jgi:hypothetical protein